MHLSHEHEGSTAPRMAMLEIYSSFIIKNCKQDFSRELWKTIYKGM